MNSKLALTAIVMFAVVMGIGSLSPALAAKQAPQEICHFSEEETVLVDLDGDGIPETPVTEPAQWLRITVNGNSVQKHMDNHVDANGQSDFAIVDPATSNTCDALITPIP